jgi:hypothetical protein
MGYRGSELGPLELCAGRCVAVAVMGSINHDGQPESLSRVRPCPVLRLWAGAMPVPELIYRANEGYKWANMSMS